MTQDIDVSANGWTGPQSPFHDGEQEAQRRAGTRDKSERMGRRMIRDHMPEDHRELLHHLPFVIVGSVDPEGRPWASLLAGRPGFLSAPDPRRLAIATLPGTEDPLARSLLPGRDLGILAIEPSTRRRNRLSGRVSQVGPDGFSIAVGQAFGNCPRFIQTRDVERVEDAEGPPPQTLTRFDEDARRLLEGADTLFIATAYAGEREGPAHGVDVSHRGGKPGFVKVESDRSLVFPDFSGNLAFNTVGNIATNPGTGLLFIDFERRDLLQMTGEAEVIWEGDEVAAFEGAERLFRFRLDRAVRSRGALPFRFRFGDYSPQLARTGTWS